jgi:pimeloyl-ACP methyl ester carboxylesterase
MFAPQAVPARWEADYPYSQILDPAAMVAEGEETAAILPFAPAGTMDFRKIRAPVHIVTGTADRVANPDVHARPLDAMLPDSRLTELPGAGHMVHHAEPDRLIEIVEEALADA